MFPRIVDTAITRVVAELQPRAAPPVSSPSPSCCRFVPRASIVNEQDGRGAVDRLLEQHLNMTFRFTTYLW
jgi:hypothetical protein